MAFIDRIRKQDAVLWELDNPPFDAQGRPLYCPPEPIKVRWEEVQEEFIDSDGVKRISKSVIYVGKKVRPGAMMWLGKLVELEDKDDPEATDGVEQVRGYEAVPDIKNRNVLRLLYT